MNYFLFTIILLIFCFSFRLKSLKDINTFHVSSLLILLCFGIVPLFLSLIQIPFYYDKGWVRILSINLIDKYDITVAMACFVIGYIFYIFGYFVFSFKEKNFKALTEKQLNLLTYIALVILFFSVSTFLIYLSSLGSIVGGYLANNRMLFESDKINISSSVSFLKAFSSLIVYSTFMLWGIKSNNNNNKIISVFYYIGLLASIFYLFYTAGRMSLIIFFITIVVAGFQVNRVLPKFKIIMLSVFAVFVMLFGKSLFRIFLYDDALERSFDRMKSGSTVFIAVLDIIGEFSFPLRSFIAALNSNSDWLFFKDSIFFFTYMFPAGYFPFIENTSIQNTRNVMMDESIVTANIPSDIFSYGYLNLGFLGFLIVPFSFGLCCKWIDSYKKSSANPLMSIFLLSFTFIIGFRVMYFDPKHLFKGSFSFFIVFSLILLVIRLNKKRDRTL